MDAGKQPRTLGLWPTEPVALAAGNTGAAAAGDSTARAEAEAMLEARTNPRIRDYLVRLQLALPATDFRRFADLQRFWQCALFPTPKP